jgi:hypothetical protein
MEDFTEELEKIELLIFTNIILESFKIDCFFEIPIESKTQ